MDKRASKELSALQPAERQRILRFLNDHLAERAKPRDLGEALVGSLGGLWKYRVGHFRLFARTDDAAGAISIARIGDRREIYR